MKAIEFKERMQSRLAGKLARNGSDREYIEKIGEIAHRGRLGKWWGGLPRKAGVPKHTARELAHR